MSVARVAAWLQAGAECAAAGYKRDKANVLEVSQLWRDTVIDVAKEFPM